MAVASGPVARDLSVGAHNNGRCSGVATLKYRSPKPSAPSSPLLLHMLMVPSARHRESNVRRSASEGQVPASALHHEASSLSLRPRPHPPLSCVSSSLRPLEMVVIIKIECNTITSLTHGVGCCWGYNPGQQFRASCNREAERDGVVRSEEDREGGVGEPCVPSRGPPR